MEFRLRTGQGIETDRRNLVFGMGFQNSRYDFGNRIMES